jgi:hypothetical protein
LLARIRSSLLRIYCIGLLNEGNPSESGEARLALRQLAEASGGRDYYPKDLAKVERISAAVADEARKQ